MKALVPVSDSAIARNLANYQRRASRALSENTMRALKADTGVFSGWCAGNNLNPLPADPETAAGTQLGYLGAIGEGSTDSAPWTHDWMSVVELS